MDIAVASAVQIGIAFVWLGMVLGISFLEAPLKFRAPGITVELGVGIGRLVFTVFNRIELLFAVGLVIATAVSPNTIGAFGVAVLAVICVVIVVQAFVLRPKMDRRFTTGQSDYRAGRQLHVPYIALECLKTVLLVVLATVAFRSL